ncbi:Spy/CpxP family protein refolding chaperone [Chelatococcus reniformis]|uniref:LTXXQ motif family protein n=1 Tax=Chelatococcus reniformis TaxID=1494448 RepID=A0A916XCR1_9HYPH|nr:Spy/CpxP family protein refolding chaperone [Chelatococcus reniformis]GGC61017.1 hypothetical protein GCM10010994_19520 [Chelatococcus reniformis]
MGRETRIGAGVAVLAAALTWGSATFAQQQAPAPAQGNAAAPAKPPAAGYTPADARAVLNARLVALKTVLELTPEQEKLWTPVEQAIRDIVKRAIARGERRDDRPPASFLTALDRIASAESARAKDLHLFVEAAKPLVDSLTEAQKRRIPAFLGLTDHPGQPQPSSQIWLFEEEQS